MSVQIVSSYALMSGIEATMSETGAMAHWPNFTLFRREMWKFDPNSPDQERAEFMDHFERVKVVQAHIAAKNEASARRVFHAKSHGCLLGELCLLPERPKETQFGIFGNSVSEKYPVLARFSNGKGTINKDWMPDVRGVALKIFTVEAGMERTIDFLMTNSQVAFGKDHAEFVEFMEATKDGGLPGPKFVAEHSRVIVSLLKCVFAPHSIAELTYGSGHAYLLGPDRAMKMKLQPQSDHVNFFDAAIAHFHQIEEPDFLRSELEERARMKGVRFTLRVQLENERDPTATPIEDALVEWTEQSSPSVPVAELVFDPQPMTDARRVFVDTLSFDPWNYHPDHRPLGNLARGRLFSYEASRRGRNSQPTMQSFATFRAAWDANVG
jgi:catalase